MIVPINTELWSAGLIDIPLTKMIDIRIVELLKCRMLYGEADPAFTCLTDYVQINCVNVAFLIKSFIDLDTEEPKIDIDFTGFAMAIPTLGMYQQYADKIVFLPRILCCPNDTYRLITIDMCIPEQSGKPYDYYLHLIEATKGRQPWVLS